MLSLGKVHLGSLKNKGMLQISPVAGLPTAKNNSGQIRLLFRQPAFRSNKPPSSFPAPAPPWEVIRVGATTCEVGVTYHRAPQAPLNMVVHGVLWRWWWRGVCIRVETQTVSEASEDRGVRMAWELDAGLNGLRV